MVDEMLNDVRKVGEDLWGAGGTILGLCLGWSSNGLRTIGEVCAKVSGSR